MTSMLPQGSLKVDQKAKIVTFKVRNPGPTKVKYQVDNVTWNWCPVKERQPIEFVLEAGGSRQFTFHPGDPEVPRWGEVASLRLLKFVGKRRHGEIYQVGKTWGAPGFGYLAKGGYTIGLTIPPDVSHCQIRNIDLVVAGKSVFKGEFKKPYRAWWPLRPARGPVRVSKGIAELAPSTNLLVWTGSGPSHGSISYSFDWRLSPWQPWMRETGKL